MSESINWKNLDRLLLDKKINKFEPSIKRMDNEDIVSMKNSNRGENNG